MFRKILNEPLVVFLLLAAAIFVLFEQVSTDYEVGNTEIVVSKNQIQTLVLGFEKVWQRSPAAKELAGLTQSYIREEVFYREALVLGLDKNDSVIRRRLSQKMQFLLEDLTDFKQADDSTLQAYLDKHADRYMQPARFSFRQIYFDMNKRGQAVQSEAVSLLAKLNKGEIEGKGSGDSIMIGYQFGLIREAEVERLLGTQFVQGLSGLAVGTWQGPILSGFGLHLVFIDQFVAAKAPKLDNVRQQLSRDWSAEKRAETNRTIYEKLRQRYHVVIEENTKDKHAGLSAAKQK